mmetsp:Transcript_97743/g.273541  ORF Transcript_97743/g.273541 Transcript_97743/m.273541 type:complete len:310 (-) Transcript_97743:569-1498(-)
MVQRVDRVDDVSRCWRHRGDDDGGMRGVDEAVSEDACKLRPAKGQQGRLAALKGRMRSEAVLQNHEGEIDLCTIAMLLRRHLRRLEVPLAAGEVDQAQDAAFASKTQCAHCVRSGRGLIALRLLRRPQPQGGGDGVRQAGAPVEVERLLAADMDLPTGAGSEVNLLAVGEEIAALLPVDLKEFGGQVPVGGGEVANETIHHATDGVRLAGTCLAHAQESRPAAEQHTLQQRLHDILIHLLRALGRAPHLVDCKVPMRHDKLAAASRQPAVVAEHGGVSAQRLDRVPVPVLHLEVEQRALADADHQGGAG